MKERGTTGRTILIDLAFRQVCSRCSGRNWAIHISYQPTHNTAQPNTTRTLSNTIHSVFTRTQHSLDTIMHSWEGGLRLTRRGGDQRVPHAVRTTVLLSLLLGRLQLER